MLLHRFHFHFFLQPKSARLWAHVLPLPSLASSLNYASKSGMIWFDIEIENSCHCPNSESVDGGSLSGTVMFALMTHLEAQV